MGKQRIKSMYGKLGKLKMCMDINKDDMDENNIINLGKMGYLEYRGKDILQK